MIKNSIRTLLLLSMMLWLGFSNSFSQTQNPTSRFSHKGVKGAIGVGGFDNGKFEDGGAGMLSLGYGFDDHFSLWLTATGIQYPRNGSVADFGGFEANLQYKLFPQSRVQPYSKMGVGIYGFAEPGSNITFYGTGFALGIGADWFFARHFGIGAEFQFKELDYSKQTLRIGDQEITTNLKPQRDGDAVGFMVTLTIQ